MARVYFDLDGVLVDPRIGIVACVNEALVHCGYSALPSERIERIIGPPLAVGFAELLSEIGGDVSLAPACVLRYRELYGRASVEGGTALAPGIADLLATLRGEAILAVATSKPLRFAEPILTILGIRDAFTIVEGPTAQTDGESKTDTLRRAIAEVDRATSTHGDAAVTFMIGDRYHDIVAARACGIVPVGATWGFGSERELRDAGAMHIVHEAAQLAPLLLQGGVHSA